MSIQVSKMNEGRAEIQNTEIDAYKHRPSLIKIYKCFLIWPENFFTSQQIFFNFFGDFFRVF